MTLLRKVKDWFVGLFKKAPSLDVVAREKLALSPKDLCEHKFAQRQVWTRVATRQYELQNEITCVVCKDRRVEAIR